MSLLNHLVIIKMDHKLREVSVPRPNCVCLTTLTSRTWHHASSTYRAVLPRFILHLLWKYGLKITLQYTIYISMYQNLLKGKILYLISCRPPSHTSIMSFWESSSTFSESLLSLQVRGFGFLYDFTAICSSSCRPVYVAPPQLSSGFFLWSFVVLFRVFRHRLYSQAEFKLRSWLTYSSHAPITRANSLNTT